MNSQIEEKNRNRARCVGKGVGLLPSLGMPPSRNLHVLNCVKLNPVFFWIFMETSLYRHT